MAVKSQLLDRNLNHQASVKAPQVLSVNETHEVSGGILECTPVGTTQSGKTVWVCVDK